MLIFSKYNNFNNINIKNFNKVRKESFYLNTKNCIIGFFFDFKFKFIRSFVNIISYFFIKYNFSYLRFNSKNVFRVNLSSNLIIFLNDFNNFFYF